MIYIIVVYKFDCDSEKTAQKKKPARGRLRYYCANINVNVKPPLVFVIGYAVEITGRVCLLS